MAKTTKRRKVWVNFYPGAGPIPDTWGTYLGTKATVRMAAQEGAEQVLLVESRPGDVVLSREGAESLRDVAHEHLKHDARTLVLALLRGVR